MADESALNKHLSEFQRAVKNLGSAVNKCEIEWNDKQFNSLSNSIKIVAASSKKVSSIGEKCRSTIKRFNSIESER